MSGDSSLVMILRDGCFFRNGRSARRNKKMTNSTTTHRGEPEMEFHPTQTPPPHKGEQSLKQHHTRERALRHTRERELRILSLDRAWKPKQALLPPTKETLRHKSSWKFSLYKTQRPKQGILPPYVSKNVAYICTYRWHESLWDC